jgi:hypothetical protein
LKYKGISSGAMQMDIEQLFAFDVTEKASGTTSSEAMHSDRVVRGDGNLA